MGNDYKKYEKAVQNCPENLPFYLGILTQAGHLHAAGYDVEEISLHEGGLPRKALIFTPVCFAPDESNPEGSHLNMTFEINASVLITIQEAAKECGVNYRTIQRWRDEDGLPVFKKGGKQLLALDMVKKHAARKGHHR